MKKIYTLILSACFVFAGLAQAPQGINYQGVARNAAGAELVNQAIGIELSIVDGSPSGTAVYTETHALTTDAHGLFALVIGNGTPVTGTFSAINWAVGGAKFLKVSMDITGGSSYQLMGTSQLMSVPYALCAGNVVNNGGKQTLVLSDDISNAQAANIIATEVGPNTQEIKVVGTTNLTSVDLSMITTAILVEISNNSALTTVNLSGLTRCDGSVVFSNNPALTSLDISSLAKITTGELTVSNLGITSLNLPALVKCNAYTVIEENAALTSVNIPALNNVGTLYLEDNDVLTSVSFAAIASISGSFSVSNNPDMTTFSFPSLTSCGSFSFTGNSDITSVSLPSLSNASSIFFGNGNSSLASVSFPALTTTNGVGLQNQTALVSAGFPSLVTGGNIGINSNPLINSVDMSSLTTTGTISITASPALTALSFPALTSTGSNNVTIMSTGITSLSIPALTTFGTNFNVSQNKLTVASINSLLAKFVSIPSLSGKVFNLNMQSPAAAPSGQGITDKATLTGNGNTVVTD